jgi:hypothetical protein
MHFRSGKLYGAIPLLVSLLSASGGVIADEEMRHLVDDARKASVQILTQIRGEVTKEMERTGPIRAIVVCKYSAPEITSVISRQTGMRVTRVALQCTQPGTG